MARKILLSLTVLVLLIGGGWFATQRPDASYETTHVRMANLPIIQGLPLYVAMDKGYFEEEGIDVEIIKFEAPNQIIDAIMTGQVDFTSPSGALGITGIADYKNPGKLKVYAVAGGTTGNSGANLITPSSSPLSSISDLKGKKLGILAGTIQWRTIAREILEKNDLGMDTDVTIVELAPSVQIDALHGGQVDALLALEPIPTIAIDKGVATMFIADPAVQYITDPIWLGAGIVNAEFAEKNPETTRKVVAVIARAIEDINKDPNAYRSYLKDYTPLTDDVRGSVPITSFKTCDQLTQEDKNSIQVFFDLFTKHQVVDGKMEVENILFCT